MAGDNGNGTWMRERLEVLKALALFEQALAGMGEDVASLRGGLGQVLGEYKQWRAEYQGFRMDYATRCAQLDSTRLKMASVVERVEAVERLMPVVKAMMWVGAILEASIIALVWALITGQAEMSFR